MAKAAAIPMLHLLINLPDIVVLVTTLTRRARRCNLFGNKKPWWGERL
jgi:hypothetical protein